MERAWRICNTFLTNAWTLVFVLVLLMEKFVEAEKLGKIPLVKLQRIMVFV